MKTTPTLIGLLAVLSAGAVLADDDRCSSPMAQWQSRESAVQHAVELGIEITRMKIDDGCYEIKGRDGDGNRVELKLDPASLGLVEFDVTFRRGADPSRYLPGARSVQSVQRQAPAGNPLFTPGSTPQVSRD